jgi:hypothetical protein
MCAQHGTHAHRTRALTRLDSARSIGMGGPLEPDKVEGRIEGAGSWQGSCAFFTKLLQGFLGIATNFCRGGGRTQRTGCSLLCLRDRL